MKLVTYYSRGGKIPLLLLPLIAILVIVLMSFFAVIGIVSMFVIGVIGLGISLFRGLKSDHKKNMKNYDNTTNTITLEKKDYDIE